MRAAVIIFPGSNCDTDLIHVLSEVMHLEVHKIWHQNESLEDVDFVALPGGFSYGDYLRSGAIARFSPIMNAVLEHAAAGKPVLGICNGFQILTECGLLPGALLRNNHLQFRCQDVTVRVEHNDSGFTSLYKKHQVLKLPIAHAEGNYFVPDTVLRELERDKRILFRYCDSSGERSTAANPNGALDDIAGVLNAAGNVLGMMPHPERLSEDILGGSDGRWLFESIVHTWKERMSL